MNGVDEDYDKLNVMLHGSIRHLNSNTISAIARILEQRDSIIQKWQSCPSSENTELAIDFLRLYNGDLKRILGL